MKSKLLDLLTLCYSHTSVYRRGEIDLEAKFEPNLLNTAIYLLSLSQQVSTFAINFQVCAFVGLYQRWLTWHQGRPFREGIRENSALYWGLVGASAVAFSGSTDFVPELNRWLQIVEMKDLVSCYNLIHTILKGAHMAYNSSSSSWLLQWPLTLLVAGL